MIELTKLSNIEKRMQEIAMEATKKCRFLKSTTKVGCCIRTDADANYNGCNFDFEWGKAIHAEENAINNMIIHSLFDDELITDVYVYAKVDQLTPCGDCRDKILRFGVAIDYIRVYLDNGKTVKVFRLDELMPYAPKR